MNVNKININQSEQTYDIVSDVYDITYEDSNVGEKLSELEGEIDEISKGKIDYHNEVYFAKFASFGMVNSDGAFKDSNNFIRYVIPNNKYLNVSCRFYTTGPEKMAIAFYNSEPSVDTFMSDKSMPWDATTGYHDYNAEIPNGCKYIAICSYYGDPSKRDISINIGYLSESLIDNIKNSIIDINHYKKELTLPYDMLSSNYPWKSMTVHGSSRNISDVASYLEGNYDACFKTYIETSNILDNKAGDYFGYRGNCAKIVSESGTQLLLFHHIADNGNDISNIKYRVYVELYADSNVASMHLHKRTSGDTQPTDITLTDSPFKGFNSFEVDINGSDIVKHATYGYNIVVKINSNQANTIRVGRFCVIVNNDEKNKRTLPVPIVQLDAHYLDGLRFGYLSSFFGKKLYTIGDSIVHQNTWQSELAKLKGLEYDAFISTESCEHPLGIGGSTICPLVRVTTDNTSDKNKALSRTGEQLRDSNGNLLWFVIGQAPNQSIYYRADYFASYYSDAGVAVIHGGENDSLTSAYSDLGNAEDAPYQGLQYVLPQYAVIAEHYDNVAILNDGSYPLDAKYLSGGYTIITQRPSFASCLVGVIIKILISCLTARLIGCSIQRRCDTLANQAETRVARYNMQKEVYEEYSIPFADFWNKQGTNKWTEYLYKPNDGIHPSALGGIRMASILANLI